MPADKIFMVNAPGSCFHGCQGLLVKTTETRLGTLYQLKVKRDEDSQPVVVSFRPSELVERPGKPTLVPVVKPVEDRP